jgi:hypothetical protein
MENSTRIYVNLSSKEFEVEGSEQFVKEYYEKIESLMSTLPNITPPPQVHFETGRSQPPAGLSEAKFPSTFGEYFNYFPRNITDVDKILVAGYFSSSQSGDKTFSTGDARKLLTQQSIKLSNPSRSLQQNKTSKKIFSTPGGRFQVSQIGIDYINNLLEKK